MIGKNKKNDEKQFEVYYSHPRLFFYKPLTKAI